MSDQEGLDLPPLKPALPEAFTPPAGATDCHAHVFGPFDRFPLAADRPYTPHELPGGRYLELLDGIGFGRGVLVQAVANGTNHGALLDALDRSGGRLRGVALVRSDAPQSLLIEMHRRGVRGVRFSRLRGDLNQGSIDLDHLEPLAPRLAQLGWHAQVQTWCDNLLVLVPRITALGIPIVIDHMGMFDVARGIADPTFRALVGLLESGKIWLKLSGAYRLSSRYPDYEDVRPFHEILVAANPERLVWGSDWPHVHMKRDVPADGHLVDLLYRWTNNAEWTRRILVDNPQALYKF